MHKARNTFRSDTTMTADARTLRWGILSTAKIATKVSHAIRRAANSELIAIASRDLDRAVAWAKQHGSPSQRPIEAHGSYESLLDDPSIDAVYIPLPPSMHFEWTIRAAERGKHVLCEKPLAANVGEAIQMAAACQQLGVQLMDGVMWVHHERTGAMRREIDSGALGRLRRVTAGFSFNWDEIPTANIRFSRDLAGGALGDLGYYCVRAIWWALRDVPQRVFATARYYSDVDMNLSAMLWFRDDRMASFDCGFDTAYRKWFEIAGTRGSLVCDDFVIPWSEDKARFWVHGESGTNAEHAAPHCVQEVRMIENFGDAIRCGVLNNEWPNDAVATMRVCDALADSAQRGEIVTIDGV